MTTDSLDTKSKQLTDFLKKEGFNVFLAKNTWESDHLGEIFWDENEDSKHFFEIAKKENIKTIIAEVKVLEKDMTSFESEEERDSGILEQLKTELGKYSRFSGKVGSYKFSWIKDGTKYSLMEATDWFEELEQIIKRLSIPMREGRYSTSRFEEEEIPEELQKKTEEELAEEMIEFIREQLPTLDRHGLYTVKELFWSKKGVVHRFTASPELRFKMSKTDMIAQKKIEEAQMGEEKERLPDLIDGCIDWCKENGLKKITKTNVKAFLAEKETSLSRNSEDVLYQRVNFKLKDLD